MKPTSMILIAVVVVAVIAVVALRPARSTTPAETATSSNAVPVTGLATAASPAATTPVTTALPRLLDLGATKCIPCKLMAPILEELKSSYVGVMRVDFIDVWEDKAAGQAHGISTIPTQIFFAPDGKELFRHEGFYAREDMLAKWKELGFDLKPAALVTPTQPNAP
jgi:thioredoxin 1